MYIPDSQCCISSADKIQNHRPAYSVFSPVIRGPPKDSWSLLDFFSESNSDCKARNTGSSLSPTITAADEPDIRKAVTDMQSHVPLDEAHNDTFGLPSISLSIYSAWPLPSGPLAQAQRVPKEALSVFTQSRAWNELGKRIYKFFDSIELKWTSFDPVRFAEAEKEPGPLFLWVGVLPGTLSPEQAKGPSARCKELLLEYGITDVEIAVRESIYTSTPDLSSSTTSPPSTPQLMYAFPSHGAWSSDCFQGLLVLRRNGLSPSLRKQ